MLIASNESPPISDSTVALLSAATSSLVGVVKAAKNTVGTTSNDSATIQVDSGVYFAPIPANTLLSTVSVNGQLFTQTSDTAPSPGQYYFSFDDNRLLLGANYSLAGLSVAWQEIDSLPPVRNQIVALPPFFEKYNLSGAFSFSLSFQGHPSGALSLRCTKSELPSVKAAFAVGTEFTMFGIGLKVDNFSHSLTKGGIESSIEVNLGLQGVWAEAGNTVRNPLDQPILEKSLVSETTGFKYAFRTALRKVGVNLKGVVNPYRYVDKNISDSQTTTGRDLLGDSKALLVHQAYIDWNSKAGPWLRKWNMPRRWVIDPYLVDLSSNTFPVIEINEKGHGAFVGGCKLSHELSNGVLALESKPEEEKTGDTKVCLVQGDRDPENPPQEFIGYAFEAFDYNKLRSPLSCFDNGQLVKKRITRCQINGTDIEVKEETFGFPFTSVDVYESRVNGDGEVSYVFRSLSEVALNTEWQLVKLIEYQYTYDPVTGHYQNKKGRGWELTRDLKETEEKEAIVLATAIANESDPDAIEQLTRELAGYTVFYKKTITGTEDFSLDDLSNFYEDLKKQDEADDNYIPPLYPREQEIEENSLIRRPDPRSTPEERLPDLVIGEKSRDYKLTQINSISPEKFVIWNPTTNQGGTNFEESAGSESYTENNGRPGLQPRLQLSSGFNAGGSDTGRKPKYQISTLGSQTIVSDGETLTYPGAFTLSQGLRAADTEYSILNSQNACTSSFPIGSILLAMRPGDIGYLDNVGWRIFEISYSGLIQPDGAVLTNASLSVGKDINVTMTVRLK